MSTRASAADDAPPVGEHDECGLYIPGHTVHYIQARLSWEDQDQDVAGVIESIDGQLIRVRVGGEVREYRNHDLARLTELSAETRDVKIGPHGVLKCQNHYVCIAPADEPWIACRSAASLTTDSDSLAARLLSDGGFMVPGTSAT